MIDEYDYFDFSSFDRMFPNQDRILKEGLGNLICLPYAGDFQNTGSYFVDDNFNKIDIIDFMKNINLNDSNINEKYLAYEKESKNDDIVF